MNLIEIVLKYSDAIVALRKAADRIEELEKANAKLRKTNARYMVKLDQFHTGYASPRAIEGHVDNKFVLDEKPSYNELAHFHENQRTYIERMHDRLNGKPLRVEAHVLGAGPSIEQGDSNA